MQIFRQIVYLRYKVYTLDCAAFHNLTLYKSKVAKCRFNDLESMFLFNGNVMLAESRVQELDITVWITLINIIRVKILSIALVMFIQTTLKNFRDKVNESITDHLRMFYYSFHFW